MKATERLHNSGQSLWLDNITRDLLTSGTLKRYIDTLSVTGLTSNPTIFDHAISKSAAYDQDIRTMTRSGFTREDLFFRLAIADLQQAADLFRPIHDRTAGVDGWVSLEVSPLLAYDTQRTAVARGEKAGPRRRKPERVRCSSLVDWPVYPRLGGTMQASTRSRNKPMQGRNFPERPPVGHLPTADLVAAVLGPGAGLRRATEIADVHKFLATSRRQGADVFPGCARTAFVAFRVGWTPADAETAVLARYRDDDLRALSRREPGSGRSSVELRSVLAGIAGLARRPGRERR